VQKQFNWVNKGAKTPRFLKNLSLFSFAGFAPLREIMYCSIIDFCHKMQEIYT
jgi:hypothetical protein